MELVIRIISLSPRFSLRSCCLRLPHTSDEDTETDGKRERKREKMLMAAECAISEVTVEAIARACSYERQREDGGKDDDAEQHAKRQSSDASENRTPARWVAKLWGL